jgi:molybdopterin-guanine dinucleotide biosynthesis protein A
MALTVRYFAGMRAATGIDHESIELVAEPSVLYRQLQDRYGWRFDPGVVRIAVNGALVDWTRVLLDGDEVVFLPPFSGG